MEPTVRYGDSEEKAKLSWLGVYKGLSKCGDVLAGFELYLVSSICNCLHEPVKNTKFTDCFLNCNAKCSFHDVHAYNV